MPIPSYTRDDFDHSPMVVFYETTRACDLLCVHCRAEAQCHPDPSELSTADAKRLIDSLTEFPKPPLLVLTGGDPIKRHDIFDLISHAVAAGLQVAMTPSATPLVTPDVVRRLKVAGLHRLAVSLDGANAATHDAFRGVAGSFDRTLRIIADAHACSLPVQVNTTLSRANLRQLDATADLLQRLGGVALWSVFFLVPTGRATESQRLSADDCEQAFAELHAQIRRRPFPIKTTEAPHYRRYVMQQSKGTGHRPDRAAPGMLGTNDGRGVMFVSHTGELMPSGFLPIAAGRFPLDRPTRVYQQSTLFRALRDADRLAGKCGACEYRHVCGGSRARAYAVTGDPLASEPDCAYVPPAWNPTDAPAPSPAGHGVPQPDLLEPQTLSFRGER